MSLFLDPISGGKSQQHEQVEKLLHSKYDREPGKYEITLHYTDNLGYQVIRAVLDPFLLEAPGPWGDLPVPSIQDIKETVEEDLRNAGLPVW